MKRMWIGAGLLALLLAAGLLVGEVMADRTAPGAEKLRQAAQYARAEEWEQAEELAGEVQTDWERIKWLAEILATHENLEQIEISFGQLDFYARTDGAAYSALCDTLASQLEALGKAHGCSLGNLL